MIRFFRNMNKTIIFLIYFVLQLFFLIILNSYLPFGLNAEDAYSFLIIYFFAIYLLFAFPKLRIQFKSHFCKSSILKAVIFSVLSGAITVLIMNFVRFVPYLMGYEPLGLGKGQYVHDQEITLIGIILFMGILTGFTEEFLFRFLTYSALFSLLKFFHHRKQPSSVHSNLFNQRKKSYELIWLLVISSIFSLMHGPDITTFHIYFIPGYLYGWLFLRYGFLAAWLCHATFNSFSDTSLVIIYYIVNAFY